MPRFRIDSDQNRSIATLRGLQRRSEFKGMARNYPIIMIAGRN